MKNILITGGSGLVGKQLTSLLEQKGYKVVLGAADTFRAAAVDQLKIWADRVGCDFYSKGMNADPASVAFDTLESAKSRGADVVLIDN